MPPEIHRLLAQAEIRAVDQTPRGPVAGDFDAVDRGAEELVVLLHDAQVAADEDEFLRPFLLVAEDVPHALAHLLLHLIRALSLLFAGEALFDFGRGSVIAASVGAHKRSGSEDVGVVDAPALNDFAEGLVVECHERFPEKAVLVAELGLHVHVEAVVDENELGFARGEAPDEDVARMRVAVDPAPEEHLSGEEVNHFGHDIFE